MYLVVFGVFGCIWWYLKSIWVGQLWWKGISLKISSQIKFRRVDPRSIGPPSGKLSLRKILVQRPRWNYTQGKIWIRGPKVPTWEGKVVEQKQKQFWKPWGKWQNMGACKIGYLKKSEIRIALTVQLTHFLISFTVYSAILFILIQRTTFRTLPHF